MKQCLQKNVLCDLFIKSNRVKHEGKISCHPLIEYDGNKTMTFTSFYYCTTIEINTALELRLPNLKNKVWQSNFLLSLPDTPSERSISVWQSARMDLYSMGSQHNNLFLRDAIFPRKFVRSHFHNSEHNV